MSESPPNPNRDDQDCGLNRLERETIEEHFRCISNIMRQHNMVKMQAGWRIEGETRDGRKVVHKFSVNGYVKSYPAGYDPGNLTMQQLKDIADV